MAARLHIPGDGDATVVEVGDQPVTLGRAPANQVVLSDSTVSRQHARVFARGSRYFVADLNSTHGTHVNGEAVSRHELRDGDELRLGKVTLRFEVGAVAASDAAATGEEQAEDDGELRLEMPDELLPQTPGAPAEGLTESGEDPFAAEKGKAAPAAPAGTAAAARPRVSDQPVRRPATGRKPDAGLRVLREDLDQRGPLVRMSAVVLALALAGGLAYGAYSLLTAGEAADPGDGQAPPDGRGSAPQRPLRPGEEPR